MNTYIGFRMEMRHSSATSIFLRVSLRRAHTATTIFCFSGKLSKLRAQNIASRVKNDRTDYVIGSKFVKKKALWAVQQ